MKFYTLLVLMFILTTTLVPIVNSEPTSVNSESIKTKLKIKPQSDTTQEFIILEAGECYEDCCVFEDSNSKDLYCFD